MDVEILDDDPKDGNSPPKSDGWGCLRSVISILAFMTLVGVVIWALNPDMSMEQAAREGVIWGGSILISACMLPFAVLLLVFAALAAFVFYRRWRKRRRRRRRRAERSETHDLVSRDPDADD